MALNFELIIPENDNISFEDLLNDTANQTDLDTIPLTFNELFQDHLLTTRRRHNSSRSGLSIDGSFKLDVECTDIDKIWDFDVTDSLSLDHLNLTEFQSKSSTDLQDVNIISKTDCKENEVSSISKKSLNVKRQSTRIQNQTRKKIADQIQRENVRLALEAQLLNSQDCFTLKNGKVLLINGKPPSPATQRYLSLPTDLDAAEEEEEDELLSDVELKIDDQQIIFCTSCQKSQTDRPMVACRKCSAWFHDDCVVVLKKEDSSTDEYICRKCLSDKTDIQSAKIAKKSTDIVVIDDVEADEDRVVHSVDDDDCLITKAVEPVKFTSNIFQLIGTTEPQEVDLVGNETSESTEDCVTPCLNRNCKALVNVEKSLYCSKKCIDIYSKMIVKNNRSEKKTEYGISTGAKIAKMTRFVLAQPATETIYDESTAPTEDNLNDFLLSNPTYKVYQNKKTEKIKSGTTREEKFKELLNNDPTKHIKVVKQFANLFKKSMPLKDFNSEFNTIWQQCIKIEEAVFDMCDHLLSDDYMLKVKELSEYLKNDEGNKLCSLVVRQKLSIADLVSMDKEQLKERMKEIVLEDEVQSKTVKTVMEKKDKVVSKQGLSLLADTTLLHGQHLYDIKCKVCNGTQKIESDTKNKETSLLPPFKDTELKQKESVDNTDIKNVDNSTDIDKDNDLSICDKGPSVCEKSSSDIPPNRTLQPNEKISSVWEGKISYKDIGTVKCKSYLITHYYSDKCEDRDKMPLPISDQEIREQINIEDSIGQNVIVNGRSNLSVVNEYLLKLRRHRDKEFVVLRLHPSDPVNDRSAYLSMFEFLYTRMRCGVVNNKGTGVKDCFIYPLSAHTKIPEIFQPLLGMGLEMQRQHLLLLVIVRTPIAYLPYKPISPKYDQDHEFVTKHGINLDRYHQANVEHNPNNSTPVESSNDVISWVLNVRSDVKTVTEDKGPHDKEEQHSDNTSVDNAFTDCCDDNGLARFDGTAPKDTTMSNIVNSHTSPRILCKDTNSSKDSIKSDPKTNTNIFLQKFADIVMNGPKKNDTENSLSKTVADIISKTDTFDPSIFQKMADIVFKAQKQEVQEPSSKHMKEQNNAWDMSLKPQPFLYKSKVVNKRENSQENREIGRGNIDSEDDRHVDFRGVDDVEKRDALPSDRRTDDQIIVSNFENLCLKRRHSNRLYTFYDSSASEEKRRRYFFSPYFSGPRSTIVSVHSNNRSYQGHSVMTTVNGRDNVIHDHYIATTQYDLSTFVHLRDV